MKKTLLIIFIGLVIFLAGCAKEEPEEIQFKNDVVTIPKEAYFVSNVAPYERGETSIQFEIHNNGDQKIPYIEVDFFDIPGFDVVTGSLECDPVGDVDPSGRKCIFKDDDSLESLDVRSITIQLKSTEDISSPTPHTISFAVRYTYFGSRDASIPVIDGLTRKQPLTKFRQSEPSVGPVVLDIDPSIEREIYAGDKTIKEYWGIGGNNPLPFLTKFKFKHIGNVEGKIKDVNISENNVRIKLLGLNFSQSCNFKVDGKPAFNVKLPEENSQYNFGVEELEKYNLLSDRNILVPFDTLLCTFKPNITQPEYSATISVFFAYKYEFVKSQSFVVQPLPE